MGIKTIAVVPAFNEEFTIGSIVTLCYKFVDSVIVVDDGSTDYTPWIAEKNGAILVRNTENKGKGIALKEGFKKALSEGGDIIVTLDSDGEHHPEDIPLLMKPIIDGECDITIGVRYSGGRGKTPLYRRVGQKILDAQTNLIAESNFTDTQSGFRCFSKKALLKITPDYTGFEAESFMLIHAVKNELTVIEVPILQEYRKDTPTMGPISHGARVLVSLIQFVGREHILLSFGTGSLMSFVMSIFFAFRTFNIFLHSATWAYGTIFLSLVLFLVGVYMSMTGLVLFLMHEKKSQGKNH
ncbi:MAG: glycosyltransferase family 2 protein [Candidatus Altiarchaeota archaeon]